MLNITKNNFEEEVLSSEVPVVLDFWAVWCMPCKMLAPNVEEIAKEYEGRAVVGKVDVDENPDLAERFGIMSIPALFVFVNGEVKEKLIGYRLKMQIADVLDKYC